LNVRDVALIAIRRANPSIVISFTLPVNPTGLDDNGLNIIATAKKDGFSPDIVNVMAMDYGPNGDTVGDKNGGAMGVDAILAANNTALQISTVGLTSHVGVTPMLGHNDDASEIFSFADATQLVDWAKGNPDISRLANWSLNRDNGSCPGSTGSYNCDGLTQQPYEFAKDYFKSFNQ
jgi:hypothetical protein